MITSTSTLIENIGISTLDKLRVGILGPTGENAPAKRIWKSLHKSGFIIVAVGSPNISDAVSFINACGGHSIVEGQEIYLNNYNKEEIKNEKVKVKACTYETLVNSQEVDIVYVTLPLELRDHWVTQCIQQRKHILLSIPAAPSINILQKWIELAASVQVLITDDATLSMENNRMNHLIEMFHNNNNNNNNKGLGEIRDIRVCCSSGQINSAAFSTISIENNEIYSHFGVLADLGWFAVAAVLNIMSNIMPNAILGRVLHREEETDKNNTKKGGIITEFTGELIFYDNPTNNNNNNNNNNNKITRTVSIYLSRHMGEETSNVIEQSLTVYGTTGSATLHDFIIPISNTESTIIIAKNIIKQGEHLRRNVREVEELYLSESKTKTTNINTKKQDEEKELLCTEEVPWHRLREAIIGNDSIINLSRVITHYRGDTEIRIKYMKRLWGIQTIIDSFLNAVNMDNNSENLTLA